MLHRLSANKDRSAHVGPVGGSKHNDAGVALKAVHFGQQLVDGLLALVIAAAHASATLAPDRVNFINEHDARRLLLRLHNSATKVSKLLSISNTDLSVSEGSSTASCSSHTSKNGDHSRSALS